MNMMGAGKQMIKQRMDKAHVASLEKLMNDFKELGENHSLRNDYGDHGHRKGRNSNGMGG